MLTLLILQSAVLAVVVVLVAGLLRSHADIMRRLHDLGLSHDPDGRHDHDTRDELRVAPGIAQPRLDAEPASDITGVKADGSAVTVGVVGTPHPTLLAFLSSTCSACRRFWDAFDDPNLRLPHPDLRLVIVTKGPEAESESEVRRLAPAAITTVMSTRAFEDYGVPVAPFFVMVDGPTGRTIGEGASATWEQLDALLRQALDDASSSLQRKSRKGSRARGKIRSQDADEVLIAAGIQPGDRALYTKPDR